MATTDSAHADESREAYEHADKPTNPPIREDERIVTREREEALRNPLTWLRGKLQALRPKTSPAAERQESRTDSGRSTGQR